jgi:hypothetical protein
MLMYQQENMIKIMHVSALASSHALRPLGAGYLAFNDNDNDNDNDNAQPPTNKAASTPL